MRMMRYTSVMVLAIGGSLIFAQQESVQQFPEEPVQAAEPAPIPEPRMDNRIPADSPAPVAPKAAEPLPERGPPKPPRKSLEKYMKPTDLGLRLTPRIARSMSELYLRKGLARDIKLSEQQATTISEQMAGRLMQLTREKGELAQELFEAGFPVMMANEGQLTGDAGRVVAEKLQPILPLFHEFARDTLEEARPHLQPEQIQKMEDNFRWDEGNIEKFSKTLQRWRDGEIREGEELFDDIKGEDGEGESRMSEHARRRRRAEHMADAEVRQAGTESWKRFLENTQHFFEYDAKQIAAANALLERYVKRADEVTTDQWKEQLRKNRMMHNFRWDISQLPSEPWLFHLDREYRQLTEPITELGTMFQEDVIGLATQQQREKALSKLRERAAQHGMSAAELNAVAFPQTQPEVPTSDTAAAE